VETDLEQLFDFLDQLFSGAEDDHMIVRWITVSWWAMTTSPCG
jgi:hypothetical protein